MMRALIIFLICMTFLVTVYIWGYQAGHHAGRYTRGIENSHLIVAMEAAKESHEMYADRDDMWWQEKPNQDAEWVEVYEEVIKALRGER